MKAWCPPDARPTLGAIRTAATKLDADLYRMALADRLGALAEEAGLEAEELADALTQAVDADPPVEARADLWATAQGAMRHPAVSARLSLLGASVWEAEPKHSLEVAKVVQETTLDEWMAELTLAAD